MKLIIDIPDNEYEYYKTYGLDGGTINKVIDNAILDGTVLPKGHGELIDKDIVLDMMNHGILEEYITVMGGVIPADK